MAGENEASLSTQKDLIISINKLYGQINLQLQNQLKAQAAIAAGAGQTDEQMQDLGRTLQENLASMDAGFTDAGGGADTLAGSIAAVGAGAGEAGDRVVGAGEGMLNTARAVGGAWDDALQTLHNQSEGPLKNALENINEKFGGVAASAMRSSDGTISATNDIAASMVDLSKRVNIASYEVRRFGEAGDIPQHLMMALGDVNKQMETFNYLAMDQGLINSLAMSEMAMQDTAQESVIQMAAVSKALNLSSAETGAFVQRQISLTGHANTDMLVEAAMYSKSVAKTVGTSATVIGKSISAIIMDTERYAHVTVEEAAQISGTLAELGMDYKDLGGMVDKYMSFEGAVESISALTSVFGVQLDSMEMMRLANTDQLGFLRKMREQFITTGQSVDTMTTYQKRLIKNQLGLQSVESVERLLDPGKALTSLEELNEATAAMAPEEGAARTQQILQDLGDEMLDFTDVTAYSTDQLTTLIRDGMLAPLEEVGIAAEQVGAKIGAGALEGGIADAISAGQAGSTNLADMFASSIGPIKAAVTEMKDALIGAFADVKQFIVDSGLVDNHPSLWTTTYQKGGPVTKAIADTEEAMKGMISSSAKAAREDLIGSLRDVEKMFSKDVPASMAVSQEEMSKFADMSITDFEKLVKESGSAGDKMAQQFGYLGLEWDSMDEKAQEAVAAQFNLGENWAAKMETLMKSQGKDAGANRQAQEASAVRMLEHYRGMGMTIEQIEEQAGGGWAEAYQEKFGMDEAALSEALRTEGPESALAQADIGELVFQGMEQRDATTAAEAATAAATAAERQAEMDNRREERRSNATAGLSRKMEANTTAIGLIKTAIDGLAESISGRAIIVQMDGEAVARAAVRHRNASPDGSLVLASDMNR